MLGNHKAKSWAEIRNQTGLIVQDKGLGSKVLGYPAPLII